MKEYLLLRKNIQSGPHTLEALRALPLLTGDLVWIEGESARWEQASARPELAGYIVRETRKAPVVTQRAETAAMPEEQLLPTPDIPVRPGPARPFRFRPAERQSARGLWIVPLFFFLVGSAVVVQKIIENGSAVPTPAAVAQATEPLPVQNEGSSADAPANFSYQNALKRESVRTEMAEDDEPAKLHLRDLRRLVRISVNSDKEGVFDGINDLQIRVHNGSAHELDQVNLEVSYRLPGSDSWHREQYSLYGIQPEGDKILVVPPVKRGAHVKYRLLGVEAKSMQEQTPA